MTKITLVYWNVVTISYSPIFCCFCNRYFFQRRHMRDKKNVSFFNLIIHFEVISSTFIYSQIPKVLACIISPALT